MRFPSVPPKGACVTGKHLDASAESVVVLCAANVVRSPLAVALLARRLAEINRSDIGVASAGLDARPGDPVAPEAVRAAAEVGLDLSGYVARGAARAEIAASALVLTMTETQRGMVERLVPGIVSRSFTLAELSRLLRGDDHLCATVTELAHRAHQARPLTPPPAASEDIADPIGRPQRHYQRTVKQLDQLVDDLTRHLLPGPVRSPVSGGSV